MTPQTIIISRTDGIGDVVLTLPSAGLIKAKYPDCRLVFLCRDYTLPVIRRCCWVDRCISVDDLRRESDREGTRALQALKADMLIHVFPDKRIALWGRKAGIPQRVGTSHRSWHWWTCNKRIGFSRRKSEEHEAVLNLSLLAPLGIRPVDKPESLIPYYGLNAAGIPADKVKAIIDDPRMKIILHPGSKGSAVEWGIDHFSELARDLLNRGVIVILTGSAEEAVDIEQMNIRHQNLHNLCGQVDLDELIMLIGGCDALVAASTGPLHLAAALGIGAVGLYAPRHPIFPQRWAPLGRHAMALVHDKTCPNCSRGIDCPCIKKISSHDVLSALKQVVPHWAEKG